MLNSSSVIARGSMYRALSFLPVWSLGRCCTTAKPSEGISSVSDGSVEQPINKIEMRVNSEAFFIIFGCLILLLSIAR